MQDVLENSVWSHHSGRVYKVLFFTNGEGERAPKYPKTVVYENVDNGNRYSRPLDDWHRSMTLIRNPTIAS